MSPDPVGGRHNFKLLPFFCSCTDRFVSDLVGTPEGQFSHVAAHMYYYKNQRTNGPVSAHLRSAVYTNVIENSPSIGADEALGPFFFSE